MSDFEFGLLYSFRNPPRWHQPPTQFYDEHIQHVVEMEELGFDAIWVTEHHFWEDGYLPSLAPMMAAIAMVTSKVWIGHSIIELPLHHPVAMAEDIAVADLLSGGRVRMGVGLGRMDFDWRKSFEHEGLVFGAPNVGRDRARMFEEQIEILKKCWKDEPFKHKGEFYDFPEINVTPKPAQKDGPKIWFGVGDRAKKPMDRAARIGHGWTGGPGGLDSYLAKVKEHGRMEEAGNAVVFMNRYPATDPEEMEAKYGPHLDYHFAEYTVDQAQPAGSAGEDEPDPGRLSGWHRSSFAEPAEIAKELDDLKARGATGALWFAPFTGADAIESIPHFASIVEDVKPLMTRVPTSA